MKLRKILKIVESSKEEASSSCPQCDSKDTSYYEPVGGKPGYEWWACRECGHKYPTRSLPTQQEAWAPSPDQMSQWSGYWRGTNSETREHLIHAAAAMKLGWHVKVWKSYPWQQIPEEVRNLMMRYDKRR